MKKSLLLLIFPILLAVACKKDKLTSAEMIKGTWDFTSGDTKYYNAAGSVVYGDSETAFSAITFDGKIAKIVEDGEEQSSGYTITTDGDDEILRFTVENGLSYKIKSITKTDMTLTIEDDSEYEINNIRVVRSVTTGNFKKR